MTTLVIYIMWVGSAPPDANDDGDGSTRGGMNTTTRTLLYHVSACVPLYYLAHHSMAPWWSMGLWVCPYIVHITLRSAHRAYVRYVKYVRDEYIKMDNDRVSR